MWNFFKSPPVLSFMPFAQFHQKYLKKNFGKFHSCPYSSLLLKHRFFKHNSGKAFKVIVPLKALPAPCFIEFDSRKP